MPRLRQLFPNAYSSNATISPEFENVVRYLNAAELGNRTLGELLRSVFDSDGTFAGPIAFRLDSSEGLQYRIGTYPNVADGWLSLATLADIRGRPGIDIGLIDGPLFHNRQDIAGTQGQTAFAYTFDAEGEDINVYINGILQPSAAYSYAAGTVTLASGLSNNGDVATFITLRRQTVQDYRRTDYEIASTTTAIAFAHDEGEDILVWLNGVLQRPGALNDYVSSPTLGLLTFTAPLVADDTLTVLVAQNDAVRRVAGLMLESDFVDAGSGLIPFTKIAIANDEIDLAKVAGLSDLLAVTPQMTVSASTPSEPLDGDFWLDTSSAPAALRIHDGVQFLRVSPATGLPGFVPANANQYVRVNGTGTAYELGTIDFSALVPKTYMGAANGVPTLGSDGKMPVNQLPATFASQNLRYAEPGNVATGTKTIAIVFKRKLRIDGLAGFVSQGSCSIQLQVDGSPIGVQHSITTAMLSNTFGTVIEIDGSASGRTLQIVISNLASTPQNLEIALATASLTV